MDLLKIRFSFCHNHKGEVKLQINFQSVSLSGLRCIVLNNKNMSIINLIEIYDVFENKTSGPVSLNVIKQLQQWNLTSPDNQLICDQYILLKHYFNALIMWAVMDNDWISYALIVISLLPFNAHDFSIYLTLIPSISVDCRTIGDGDEDKGEDDEDSGEEQDG
ncbi:hypothetical protein QTP88_010967 [Uroleucon formosanum]